jgi:thiamine pyrophosphate-dependent acetolactate synthase large subunit-like protein
MNVAEAVGRALAGLGARHVFGVLGSGNFLVTNALVEHGATFLAARHEGGAITMADAYARVSGRVGVCSVHQGPGLTNAMTGLTEAAKSRTPLVVLAADTAASAIRSNFRIEQDQLVRSVGAMTERLHGPASAVADAVRAWRRAEVERRTVVLMMPLDVQAATSPHDGRDLSAPLVLHAARPAQAAIAKAADMLAQARRPLIIAGRGAVLADAREPLERLGEHLGALLATSANGNGLFTGNLWSLGISGGFASPAALELIALADVVLSVGAGLNMWTTRHGRLVSPTATVIQVDRDTDAIGAHHRVDMAVVGDAAEAARALLAELEGRQSPPASSPCRTRGGAQAQRAPLSRAQGHGDVGPAGREYRAAHDIAADAAGKPEGRGPVVGVVRAAPESSELRGRRDEGPGGEGFSGWRTPDVAERIQAGTWKATPYEDAGTATQIDPRTLSAVLDDVLPQERTLAVDSGHFMGYPPMYLRVPDPQGFVFTQAFQAIGLGLASAIGVAVARPDRLTVTALGDGGAMMALPELETVARLGLRMLIVIYNDAAYGAEVHHFEPQGHSVELVQFPDVDFAALGRAAGLQGATIRRRKDLDVVTAWLAEGATPGLVLDAKVVPTVVAEWLEEAFRGH